MIAKLIVHAPTRTAAALRLSKACAEVEVYPVATNAAFLSRTLAQPAFLAGEVDTRFLEDRLDTLAATSAPSDAAWIAAARALARPADSGPWQALTGFRLNAPARFDVKLVSGDAARLVEIEPSNAPSCPTWLYRDGVVVFEAGEAHFFREPDPDSLSGEATGDGAILSPMPGKIVHSPVKVGDAVKKGDPILTLEAMKMEHVLTAPFDAVVASLEVALGDQVVEGKVLARLDKAT